MGLIGLNLAAARQHLFARVLNLAEVETMHEVNYEILERAYLEWEKARVLPNPGTCYERWGRFLFHLYRQGEITAYQMDAYRLY